MPNNKLLIVEDEKELNFILREYFESLGYNVSSASNLKDALDLLKHNRFKAILTDGDFHPNGEIREPHPKIYHGIFHYLVEKRSKLPVIVFSGNGNYRDEALHLGARAFITKPFPLHDLEAEVSKL